MSLNLYALARPFLFKLDPEAAHDFTLASTTPMDPSRRNFACKDANAFMPTVVSETLHTNNAES